MGIRIERFGSSVGAAAHDTDPDTDMVNVNANANIGDASEAPCSHQPMKYLTRRRTIKVMYGFTRWCCTRKRRDKESQHK